MSEPVKHGMIGFVGLGNMGYHMAGNLVGRGRDVIVLDSNKAAVARFVDEFGARAANDISDLAPLVDVLILMVPNGRIVREILLAEASGGKPPAGLLKPGAVVLDMSSSDPMGTRALGQVLSTLGIRMMDAPVSGGVGKAKTGLLAVMSGGDAELAEEMAPILACMSGTRIHVGPLGAGHAMKALNNYVSAVGLLAACEAVRLAEQFGIDGQDAVNALNASTGRNNSTENKLSSFVLSGTYASGFSYGLMRKDLETALHLAEELAVHVPLAESFIPIWSRGEETVGQNADHTHVDKLISARG